MVFCPDASLKFGKQNHQSKTYWIYDIFNNSFTNNIKARLCVLYIKEYHFELVFDQV